MKTSLLLLICLTIGIVSCQKHSENLITNHSSFLDTISFSHSMKGWELYSLPQGDDWTYSILMGTNRGKSFEEVASNTIKVMGKDSLKMLLAKFPANENLLWRGKGVLPTATGDFYNLTLPDDNIVNEIKDFCAQKGFVLNISK